MRGDLLKKRRGLHIALTKEVHAALRATLFVHGLSMQDVFDDYANRIASGDHTAMRFVEKLAMEKLKQSLLSLEEKQKLKRAAFGEYDCETLYGLINEDSHNARIEQEDEQ
jgi:hypothetical protein